MPRVKTFYEEIRAVNRVSKIVSLGMIALLALGALSLMTETKAYGADAPAEVKPAGPSTNVAFLQGAAFGVGLVIIGAGYGIGKIGACAVENMARQPEVAGNIQTAMVITAAMIEGATLLALIVLIIV